MADQKVTFILEAVDNASDKFREIGANIREAKAGMKDYGAALDSLIGGTAILAGAAGLAVNAFASEEDQIVRAARANSRAAGSFEMAKLQITALNKELEPLGITTEETTQAVTLLTQKAGVDFPDALRMAGDLAAYAQNNNISLAMAIRRLTEDEQLNASAFAGSLDVKRQTIDTSDKIAQTQNRVNELLERLGEKLLPAVEAVLSIANSVLDTMIRGADNLQYVWEGLQEVWNTITFSAALVEGAMLGISGSFANMATLVNGTIDRFTKDIETKWKTWTDGLIAQILKFSSDLGKEVGNFITGVTSQFTGLISSGLQWGRDLIDNVIKGIQEKAKELYDRFSGAVGDVKGAVQSFLTGGATGLAATGVRPLAAGGIITEPTAAILGEGGENEYVIPESKMSMFGGRTINVYNTVTESKDARLMARELSDAFIEVLNASNSVSIVSQKVTG